MNVLLVNDTSKFHCGSASVVNTIKTVLSEHSLITTPVIVPQIKFDCWDSIDHVIVNGEGTLHNNRQGAVSILNLAQRALDAGCTVSIVNSIWQNMDTQWKSVTDKLCVWSVRDPLSQQYASKEFKRTPDLCPDYSWFEPVTVHKSNRDLVGIGGSLQGLLYPNWQEYTRVNIFENTWNDLVNLCAECNVLASGRHHELYAACRAGIPFVALDSNSWKNHALACHGNIPVLDHLPETLSEIQQFASTYKDQYSKIFNWMHSYTLEDVQAHLLTR